MTNFARIFELEHGQLLVFVTPDHTGGPMLQIITTINHLQYQYRILFERWDEAYLALTNYTDQDAKELYAEVAAGVFSTREPDGTIH